MPSGKPTAEDLFWLDQVPRLAPKESLDRLDTQAKYLFTLAASAGTLLTGFGIVSTTVVGAPSPLVLVPIALLAMSLAAAMMAITPRFQAKDVDLTELYSIRAYYEQVIGRKARFVSAAGVLCALALFSSPLAVARKAKNQQPNSPIVSAILSETAGKAKLNLKLETDNVAQDATLHLAVTGRALIPAPAAVPLATYDGFVAGKPSLTVEMDRIDEYSAFDVDYTFSTRSSSLSRRGSLRLFRSPAKTTPTPGTVASSRVQERQEQPERIGGNPCPTPKR
jgi:hypothetical protein